MNYTDDHRDCLIQSISDLSKDVNGVRIRRRWGEISDDALESMFRGYKLLAEHEMQRQRLYQAEQQQQFERDISSTIAMGAQDRATAIRWIVEGDCSDGDGYDAQYALTMRGLPRDYVLKLLGELN